MSKFIFINLILVFSSCSQCENLDDLSKRNGNWVWFHDAKTDQGNWIPKSKNGQNRDGEYYTFYFNGNMQSINQVEQNGQKETKKLFDLNEKLIAKYQTINDSIHEYFYHEGKFQYYYSNGKMKIDGIVENHQRGKSWKNFYVNGRLENKMVKKEDQKWIISYHPNGKVNDSLSFKNNMLSGYNFQFYSNGNLKLKTYFNKGKGEGKYEIFYENGKYKEIKYFKNGWKEGFSFFYFENGNLSAKKTFLRDTLHGEVTFYHENGKIRKKGSAIKGKFHGIWKEYSPSGKLLYSGLFEENDFVKMIQN